MSQTNHSNRFPLSQYQKNLGTLELAQITISKQKVFQREEITQPRKNYSIVPDVIFFLVNIATINCLYIAINRLLSIPYKYMLDSID